MDLYTWTDSATLPPTQLTQVQKVFGVRISRSMSAWNVAYNLRTLLGNTLVVSFAMLLTTDGCCGTLKYCGRRTTNGS